MTPCSRSQHFHTIPGIVCIETSGCGLSYRRSQNHHTLARRVDLSRGRESSVLSPNLGIESIQFVALLSTRAFPNGSRNIFEGGIFSRETYFAAQFGRIAARRGKKRALLAVAHSLLVAAYEMLKHKEHYQEFGADFFEGLNKDQVKRRLVQRLAKLGFQVTVTETPTAE